MKILWGITIASSLIFVIQTVMTFLGADAGDFDVNSADIPGDLGADIPDGAPTDFGPGEAAGTDGMSLYTFRNFVNFFLGFGWTAVLLSGEIESKALLLFVAILVGILLVFLVMLLFKWLSGMQQSGTINIYKQAVGCQGKVYLSIPAARSGQGKVQITINNSIREYDAVTDGEALPTSTAITVSDVIDGNTVLVETSNSLII